MLNDVVLATGSDETEVSAVALQARIGEIDATASLILAFFVGAIISVYEE